MRKSCFSKSEFMINQKKSNVCATFNYPSYFVWTIKNEKKVKTSGSKVGGFNYSNDGIQRS